MSITLENVKKSFGDKRVLQGLSYAFEPGIYVITGPSGAGKTTLLNVILGTVTPDDGMVTGIDGARIGCVWQEDRLCENLSAHKNVALVCEKPDYAGIEALLAALGIEPADRRKPVRTLSGGMKRRVAVARALINPAPLYAFDEPFKGLDEKTEERVIEVILERTLGACVLIVSHEAALAKRLNATEIGLGKLATDDNEY
ncbi:MAG: ABC transporter ATP-binding protein [Clostridiales bacterium]|jgi:NitT/TauT family transport system ATP-binding protein|nr:ABC transporter ATP-binding protein [Clostridiales bacterium]